jgi:hypothetical protein
MMPAWLDDWLEKTRLTHAGPARYRPTIRVKNVIAAFGASAVAATAHAFGETTEGAVRIFAAAVGFVVLAALAVGMVQAARDHGRRSWEAREMAFSGTGKAWLAAIAVAVLAVLAPLSLVLR